MIEKKKNKFESLEGSGCLELHLIMGLYMYIKLILSDDFCSLFVGEISLKMCSNKEKLLIQMHRRISSVNA